MVMQRVERAFRPGQAARARLTITNDGDVPMRYAVEVSPGVTAPLIGFVAEETSVLVTDLVQPGRSATVRVPLSLPPEIGEGRKVVRVRIGEAGPEGEILNVLDEEFFSGLLRVEVPRPEQPPVPTPPPAPPPTEVLPLPGEPPRTVPPQALSPGDILLAAPTVSPAEPGPGQAVGVRVPLTNAGPVQAPVRVLASVIDARGSAVLELPPDTFAPQAGREVVRSYSVLLPATITRGQAYGLGVTVTDVATGVFLADQDFPMLFSVPALPAPEALVFGDVRLGQASARPADVRPGERVTLSLPLTNTGPIQAPLRIEASIIDTAGSSVLDLAPDTVEPRRNVQVTRDYTAALPPEMVPGSYGLGVDVLEAATGTLLAQRDFPGLFSVAAPVLPAPAGLLPGDLALLDPVAEPGVANPGQTVQIQLPFFNSSPIAPPITADVFILGPQGTAVATLPRLTFSPELGVATLRTVRWTVPQAAAPGSYGVQVFAWDPNTFVPGDPSTFLIREQVLDVFTVETVPVPPEEVAPMPGDLGVPIIAFTPSTVEIGQPTQGSVSIPNLVDFPFTARVTVSLIDSAGQGVQTVVSATDLALNPLESRSLGFSLNTSGLEPDTYGLRVVAVDPFTGTTLMDQNIPGGLQVAIPAALRGVNEFTDIRWFYNGLAEPPDPRVLRLGPPPPLPITKTAGAPTGGFVLLRHRGEGGRFNIGYGTAAAQVFGHGDPFRFFIAQEEIPPHLVATDIVVVIPQGPWPSAALTPPGRYDALKFIDNAETRQSIYQNWDDDVFQVAG